MLFVTVPLNSDSVKAVLRLWQIIANIYNEQSRRADEGWSSRLVVERGGQTSAPKKKISKLQNVTQVLGLGQIFWNDLKKGKWS